MTRDRRPTKDELDLWQRFTADVERLTKEAPPAKTKLQPKKVEEPTSKPKARHPAASQRETYPSKPAPPPAIVPDTPLNTDRRTWERLKRGKITVEKRLDLHGRTQIEAHDALDRFLAMSAASGLRCVLIVTGKGVNGDGVLRQMVPRWLAEPDNREKIITYCTAHPRHGGAGALYVLIKRRRSQPVTTGGVGGPQSISC